MKIFVVSLLSTFLMLFYSCTQRHHEKSFPIGNDFQKSETIRIFRLLDKYSLFYLKINNDFFYYDSSSSCPPNPPGLLINEYQKKNDILRIFLKINYRDTSFIFNSNGIDSLLIGLSGKNTFYIRTEKDVGAWFAE